MPKKNIKIIVFLPFVRILFTTIYLIISKPSIEFALLLSMEKSPSVPTSAGQSDGMSKLFTLKPRGTSVLVSGGRRPFNWGVNPH